MQAIDSCTRASSFYESIVCLEGDGDGRFQSAPQRTLARRATPQKTSTTTTTTSTTTLTMVKLERSLVKQSSPQVQHRCRHRRHAAA
jgi:hypothetical protein